MKKYNFALSWNSGRKEKFIKWTKKECALRKLKFLLINDRNVARIIDSLEKGRVKIEFMLDNDADYDNSRDLYARLCYAVKDSGGYVVCDPDDARQAANKAVAHYDLVKANIPVPYTVVVRHWEPDDFKLTKDERSKLGKHFIIKPSSGFGEKGVIKNADGSIDEIAKARHFNRGDNFLLQKKVMPVMLGGKRAWFRTYFIFGEAIPCWWDNVTYKYSHVSLRDLHDFKLLPLVRITSEIARITNMDFFSTEIAITEKNKTRRFIVVDYVNDQPELCVRTEKQGGGPVPEVVRHVAEKIVDIAWRMLRSYPLGMHRSIWLVKAKLEDENL